MQERKELDVQQELQALRASRTATRVAIEALMASLPPDRQKLVLQHLRQEAKQLHRALGSADDPILREAIEEQAKLVQGLVQRLEQLHLAAAQPDAPAPPESVGSKD